MLKCDSRVQRGQRARALAFGREPVELDRGVREVPRSWLFHLLAAGFVNRNLGLLDRFRLLWSQTALWWAREVPSRHREPEQRESHAHRKDNGGRLLVRRLHSNRD